MLPSWLSKFLRQKREKYVSQLLLNTVSQEPRVEWLLTYRVKLKLPSIKGKSKADINIDNISDLKNGTRWALVSGVYSRGQ